MNLTISALLTAKSCAEGVSAENYALTMDDYQLSMKKIDSEIAAARRTRETL